MANLASQARLTTIGGRRVPDDDLGKNCRAVWEKVLSGALGQNDGRPADGGIRTLFATRGTPATSLPAIDSEGWQWTGALTWVIRSLWPGLDDGTESQNIQRDINRYLLMTGNLVCVEKSGGKGAPSKWWLPRVWTGRQLPENWRRPGEGGTSAAAARAAARAAQREDEKLRIRNVPPGPVITSFRCQW